MQFHFNCPNCKTQSREHYNPNAEVYCPDCEHMMEPIPYKEFKKILAKKTKEVVKQRRKRFLQPADYGQIYYRLTMVTNYELTKAANENKIECDKSNKFNIIDALLNNLTDLQLLLLSDKRVYRNLDPDFITLWNAKMDLNKKRLKTYK